LWDEAQVAYHGWRDAGEPKLRDWLVTVSMQDCARGKVMRQLLNGSYAPIQLPLKGRIAHRWFWLRTRLRDSAQSWWMRMRDNAGGYPVHREWGRWTIRPAGGWRSIRWITPPTHTTRAVLAGDHDAAVDWFMDRLEG
jgi:hypothetical protein